MRRATAIIGAVLVVAACQGPAAATPAASVAASAAASETTVPPPTSPTLEPTPEPTPGPLLPGRLLFTRFNEATHTTLGSFTARTNGTEEAPLPLPWEEPAGAWSTSGREISVATLLSDGRVGTAIIDAAGTVLRILEIGDPTLNLPCAAWSADDARLACEGWDDTDPSRRGIYTVRASDGGDIRRLTTPPEGSGDIPGDFSIDGQLVFKRGPAEVEGAGALMIVSASGGEPRRIGTGVFEDPGRFSPEGESIATSVDGRIVVADLEGRGLSAIDDPDAFLFGPSWSPDGMYVVFSRTERGFIADLFISRADGTDRHQVTRTSANEINVDWGVDPE
jgi:hypothetical protein